VRIVAVGNPFCGDDGVGAAVLERIRAEGLFPGAELIDAGTDALSLLDRFAETGAAERLHIIIDAAKMGCEPGRVVGFAPAEARRRIVWDRLSLHGLGLAEAFALAEGLGAMPRRVVVVGVEPTEVRMDRGLSDAVAAAVPEVIRLIRAEVRADEADHTGH